MWSTLKAVHATGIKDSGNPKVRMQLEIEMHESLVVDAVCTMDGFMSGMIASRLKTIIKQKDSMNHAKEQRCAME